jgi:hypothetical protein
MPPRETGKNWGFERAAAKVQSKIATELYQLSRSCVSRGTGAHDYLEARDLDKRFRCPLSPQFCPVSQSPGQASCRVKVARERRGRDGRNGCVREHQESVESCSSIEILRFCVATRFSRDTAFSGLGDSSLA